MLSPGTFAYDSDFRFYKYDPEKAKQLLAEAGYPDGFEINWDIFQYGTGELVESWIQRDLKKIGVNVKIQKHEWIAYLRRWAAGMNVSPWLFSLCVRPNQSPARGANPHTRLLFDPAQPLLSSIVGIRPLPPD